ncbi:MAG TPA: hypothetical protein VER11_26200 [Polyangiaceae bacterium]|nr:hypothetical protein [Polyangiaceae bacterium]
MRVFSFHLAKSTVGVTTSALFQPLTSTEVPGLRHAECMAVMALGSPILSPARLQLTNLAVFASWESEGAIDRFLTDTVLGRRLALGWHVRLDFVRRWGRVSQFEDLPENVGNVEPDAPVVAVTLARLKLAQVPRFIRWGKPVEELVRDHPGATLALAAIRPPRTVSTFSVWRSLREMTNMVHGRDSVHGAKRHASAMLERNRKDFHHEFTTLRFRALSEHGEWQGRSQLVPRTT